VLGIAGNWLGNWLRELKRIVNYQIKCRPFTDFASMEEIVPILANVVNDKTGIESAEVVK
jgi:hypothetical protein